MTNQRFINLRASRINPHDWFTLLSTTPPFSSLDRQRHWKKDADFCKDVRSLFLLLS
ncbi:hypothetical protein A0H81_06359 [Grifola frondosa]|uniref:Uncharacterized protein n=1 Tax=Grifola frondosa TaxID=5627 RepID=A0A1C7MFX1_GRIFR|nr:hypothetical protein A0H81_06359 [Grifola frondosa]